jgi:hypothetical protein
MGGYVRDLVMVDGVLNLRPLRCPVIAGRAAQNENDAVTMELEDMKMGDHRGAASELAADG